MAVLPHLQALINKSRQPTCPPLFGTAHRVGGEWSLRFDGPPSGRIEWSGGKLIRHARYRWQNGPYRANEACLLLALEKRRRFQIPDSMKKPCVIKYN